MNIVIFNSKHKSGKTSLCKMLYTALRNKNVYVSTKDHTQKQTLSAFVDPKKPYFLSENYQSEMQIVDMSHGLSPKNIDIIKTLLNQKLIMIVPLRLLNDEIDESISFDAHIKSIFENINVVYVLNAVPNYINIIENTEKLRLHGLTLLESPLNHNHHFAEAMYKGVAKTQIDALIKELGIL